VQKVEQVVGARQKARITTACLPLRGESKDQVVAGASDNAAAREGVGS